MIYDNDQTRKYRVGHMTMDITYSDTTDEYYKKLKVLRAVMDNWAKQNRNLPIDSSDGRRYGEDCEKFNEMKTLLQISTDNFDKGSRGKKHKRLMNEIYKRYNKLKELFKYHAPNFLNKSKWFIKKKHMIEVNELYKRYNV